MILYEYPLNERIRTLLRLEDLFGRYNHFVAQADAPGHHVALMTVFEILEVAARADLKTDLLAELDRQRQAMLAFRDNPNVSAVTLSAVIVAIENAHSRLSRAPGKAGQHLRENDWLMSIRSRAGIAGGTCEFDIPSYHAWLNRPNEQRQRDFSTWMDPLAPLRESVGVVLRLLRDAADNRAVSTQGGSFQQTLAGKPYQMLQVRVDATLGAVPEISANRHMLWIRFTTQGIDQRPRPFESDVEFTLGLCNL